TKPTKSLQQDFPVPSLPHNKTTRQPTPGPSGTQWLEDSFHEPSQMDEPPIQGPSPSSKLHEDIPTCEPEPEVAPTQSMGEPFAHPTPPHSVITINNMPIGSPHSHNDSCQEFTNLKPTLMIPRSINHILLEHRQLLHMIPFVDATH
ncbi:hypothetical protein O181_118227, partial [Austropuccinia psidii MF-1]|nr:hypothetical protein [Austropuccinia psidii MF-1]